VAQQEADDLQHATNRVCKQRPWRRRLVQDLLETGTCAQVGRLWTSLADYYIRQGMYESARDVYEEGLTTVTTVRDFSLIFDTLTQFEETLLQHKV
jgi:pentatricopeptide repeat protein